MGDIRFVDDRVEVEGPLRAKAEIEATGGLLCRTGEIRSVGAVSGFSFSDRSVPEAQQGGWDKGVRYVWYADKQSARLWSASDLVTVRPGAPNLPGAVMDIPGGMLRCEEVRLAKIGELSDVIRAMQADINELRNKLGLGIKIGQKVEPKNEGGRPPIVR